MATWKKVITEDDSIGIAQGGTGLTSITAGNIIVGNGTSTPSLVHLDESQILVGAGAGTTAPIKADLIGDVTILHSSGTVTSTIGVDKVTGLMVKDLDLDWVTHQATAGSAANATKIPIFDASGVAALSPAGANGNVLTVNGSGGIIWANTAGASTVNISNTNGSTGAKAIALVAGASDAATTALMQDTDSAFTWNDSNDTLTIGEVTIAGDDTSEITADAFTGLASKATKIAVTAYAGNATSLTCQIPHFSGAADGSQEDLLGDSGFTYNPGSNILSVPAIDASGNVTASVLVSDVVDGTAPLTVTSTTIVPNLHVAKAGIATTVDVASTTSSASEHYLTFVTATGAGAALHADATDLVFIPEDATAGIEGGTLKVPNLTVTGTTTSLNTVNLEVKDKTIKVADENDTSANAIGSGIIVDINNAASANLPSILYAGQDNSASGWSISRANHATAGAVAITTGIGTMQVVSDITDSNYETGNSGAIDFGVGAFCYSSNAAGGLYIQTVA